MVCEQKDREQMAKFGMVAMVANGYVPFVTVLFQILRYFPLKNDRGQTVNDREPYGANR